MLAMLLPARVGVETFLFDAADADQQKRAKSLSLVRLGYSTGRQVLVVLSRIRGKRSQSQALAGGSLPRPRSTLNLAPVARLLTAPTAAACFALLQMLLQLPLLPLLATLGLWRLAALREGLQRAPSPSGR